MAIEIEPLDRHVDQQEACSLFRLPGELRTYIYELVLLAGVARYPDGLVHLERRTRIAGYILPPTVLSVLATCRLVYHEAVGIFYERVHVDFTSGTKSLIEQDRDFFRILGQPRLDAIVALHITKRRINNIAWLCKQLKQLSGLKILSFFIIDHEYDTENDLHRKMWGNRIGLLRALARMDQLEAVSLSFSRGVAVSSEGTRTVHEFVAELNAVIPRNWNAAHPANSVPHALKH